VRDGERNLNLEKKKSMKEGKNEGEEILVGRERGREKER